MKNPTKEEVLPDAPPTLTNEQQQELLRLARTAITDYLTTGRTSDYETDDPALSRYGGAFVTLRMHHESLREEEFSLRGCIGHIWTDMPLYEVVPEMAIYAATADPRFPPLKVEDLAKVSIEISILSPMHRITDIQQIQVGVHGLVISQSGRQGVLLPQVPLEQGWNREEFLENLCLKAGLSRKSWTKQPTLYAFTTLIIEEQ